MKILLIGPSNNLYMPYFETYKNFFIRRRIHLDTVVWNRLNIEEKSTYVYNDKLIGVRRNLFDYMKFSRYINKNINYSSYDYVIVFSLQLMFFLGKNLLRNKSKFILDIRDRNKIISFMNMKKYIKKSEITVISSPGYKKWLPESDNIIVNHNISNELITELNPVVNRCRESYRISFIGAARDFKINKFLITKLKNNPKFSIDFFGDGNVIEKLKKFTIKKSINNVFFKGRYAREQEQQLYDNTDIINVLRLNDSINNYTALPNRLYKALIYGKPLLAYKGTYLSDLITEFKIGLVLNKDQNVSDVIIEYFDNFNRDDFDYNRMYFLEYVFNENNEFEKMLDSLVEEE